MGFACDYLKYRSLFPPLIEEAPRGDTGIIVVIPSFNEPDIEIVLNSLKSCIVPPCGVEVVIIVNAPEGATPEQLDNNRLTVEAAIDWKKKTPDCFFRLYVRDVTGNEPPEWGVGMARKTGMDEAVRRLDILGNPDGVILSLDADCTVGKNYFTEVFGSLLKKKERTGCSVFFEHPSEGDDFPSEVYRSVVLYELHLRYYFRALSMTGFPYVHHTVGSAIAVKALSYVRSGGMNRRQAGEDFYFIQKLVQTGGFFNLNSTTVYPSPRVSDRVPFGTGPAVAKMLNEGEGTFLSYNPAAFEDLGKLFGKTEPLYGLDTRGLRSFHRQLPDSLKSFIGPEEWQSRVTEIRNNTSGQQSFRKRFFSWFNMFKVVKYLNFVHDSHFEKKPVVWSASGLISSMGALYVPDDPAELLFCYRVMERSA